MGKGSLIIVLGASMILSVMNLQLNKSSERAVENMVGYYNMSLARDIANQSISYLLTELADSAQWRVAKPKNIPSDLFSGVGAYSATYTIIDTTINLNGVPKEAIKLWVTALYGEESHVVVVYTDRNFGYVPPVVRGAFTADGPLDNTISDMQIDGRDYTWDGTLVPESGVFGVSSGTAFSNTKNAMIGGTDVNSQDYAMNFPHHPAIVEENYGWGGAFPVSPDAALGYDNGTLKTLALNGTAGSQYVTDPKNLVYPLRGITYVELAAGVTWKSANLGENPEGILVISNAGLKARVENIHTKDEKTAFKGIIIADYMFHIHMDVLGAIVLLSPNQETKKECKGNQGHRVFYSSESIKRATNLAGSKGSGWRGRIPVFGWRE